MSAELTIYTHSVMQMHDNGFGHPECGNRLKAIIKMIENEFPKVKIENSYPADDDDLLLAHPQSYIDYILDSLPFEGHTFLDGDTSLSPQSYDAALMAVGASIQAVKAVLSGETKTAFAAIRPPGHHAEHAKAMGFCLFGNAFIAARKSQIKTLIIDFDVHHGNGTEDLVKRYVVRGGLDIAYASTHQEGIFPYTGIANSLNICNAPLSRGDGSEQFRYAIENIIIPFALKFNPQLIIFSAGFDAHKDDPLAELNLTHEDFGWVVDQFRPVCQKMVSLLEGGYNLQTLPISIKHHLKALAKT